MFGLCRISFESNCHAEVLHEDLPVDLQIAMHRSLSPVFVVKCSDPISYVADLMEVNVSLIKDLCVKMEHRVFVIGALTYATEKLCEKMISLVLFKSFSGRHSLLNDSKRQPDPGVGGSTPPGPRFSFLT